jgi:hypothetical protein
MLEALRFRLQHPASVRLALCLLLAVCCRFQHPASSLQRLFALLSVVASLL